MPENRDHQEVFALARQISDELDGLELSMSAFFDEDISRDVYLEHQSRFNYVQGLFDRFADLVNGITFDQNNPDLYELLECKEDVSKSYGRYRCMCNSLTRQYEKGALNREGDERERTFVPQPDEPESADTPEEEPEAEAEDESDADLLAAEEEALAEEEREEKRKAKEQQRKEFIKADREEAERARQQDALHQEYLREQDAARAASLSVAEAQRYEAEQFAERQRLEAERLRAEQDLRARQESADAAGRQYADPQSQIPESPADTTTSYTQSTSADPYADYRRREQERLADEQRTHSYQTSEPQREQRQWEQPPAHDTTQQYYRQQEAARLDLRNGGGQQYSEADLRRERIRQEEERIRAEQREQQRRAEQQAVQERYRQRMERSHRTFEDIKKSHIDFSVKGDPSSPPAQTQSSRYVPFGVAGGAPAADAVYTPSSASPLQRDHAGVSGTTSHVQRFYTPTGQSVRVIENGRVTGSNFVSHDRTVGTTGQSKGVNPNKVTKESVEEAVTNIFGKSSKLQRESVVAHYSKCVGYKVEGYAMMALARAGRKVYQMAQNGGDDGTATIRTFEEGRYYLKTGYDVRRAIQNFHVVDSKAAICRGAKSEFQQYGKYTTMTKKELATHNHEAIKANRALKKEIKELWAQGSALSPEERRELLAKTAQLAKSSHEVGLGVGYQKLQQRNANSASAAQDLESRRHLLTTRKTVDKAIKELRKKSEADMAKKFGELTRVTDKSLAKKIQEMKSQGADLKRQIQLLQSKGSALTASERKYLAKLMEKHKALGAELKRLTGLRDARKSLDGKLKAYTELRKKVIKNLSAFTSGFYVLYNFGLKAIREGSEIGAQGLGKAADIVANRHVRKVVVKTVKLELKAARWAARKTGVEAATKWAARTTGRAIANSAPGRATAKAAGAVADAGSKAASVVAKKAARTAVNAKAMASRLTPQFVKTAARKTVAGKTFLKNGLARLKNRFANSALGRAASAVRRAANAALRGIRTALSFIKGLLIKAVLAILGFILLVGLVVAIIEVIASASSSVIMAPTNEDGSKINLAPYVEIVKEEQAAFEAEIVAIQEDPDYDDVIVEYTTTVTDNSREILSMMAVRMSQDLDMTENPDVEPYLRSLHNDSHFYTTKKTPYNCTDYENCNRLESYRVEGECTEECEEDCKEDHSYLEYYCGGHIRVHVKVSILGFDEIFTADTMGNAEVDAVQGSLIGHATVTYYCTEQYPHICNAGPPYKTALGTDPTPGKTIAVDPNRIPLGSHVIIDGHEYVAEDTGGKIDGFDVDIVVGTHAEALSKGTRYNVPVYRANYEGEGIQDSGKWNGWTEDNIEWCKAIWSVDWSDLYDGIEGLPNIVGIDTDLSGVEFIDGDRQGNQEIVDIALSQVGNVGGRPYWSWYGFNSRVEWCACFVSWCANEDGSLHTTVPKFAACSDGLAWFRSRGQWAKRGDITPAPGDIIFFDWEPDGSPNHVGIVVGTDGSKVYTVEGNSSGDRCRTKSYALDSQVILGYGVPNY